MLGEHIVFDPGTFKNTYMSLGFGLKHWLVIPTWGNDPCLHCSTGLKSPRLHITFTCRSTYHRENGGTPGMGAPQ